MPDKKNTLLIIVTIVLVSLVFNHKLYGYIELTLNKLTSISQSNEILNTRAQIKIKKNDNLLRVKTGVKQHPNIANSSQQYSSEVNNIEIKRCQSSQLTDITTETHKYLQADGSIGYRVIKKYYELDTNLGKGYEEFLTELTLKLNAVFQHIESQLGIKLQKKIKLNFVFQATRAGYEDYLIALGQSPEGNQGMYLSYNNLSIVDIKNKKQGITTAIHEAIHAFNNTYWGDSLRFFNEGMAQHFSAIYKNGSLPPFNFSWLQHQEYPMQISTLLFSETDWHSNKNHELYQNSKALFHFLMNNEKGRKVLLKIMKLEMKDHCTTLPKETIEEILIDIFPNHEQEFNYWFTDGLKKFLNREQV